MIAHIYTDASFCDRSRAAGFGAYIRLDEKEYLCSDFLFGCRKSIEAEIYAAYNGLYLAKQLGAQKCHLYMDNDILIRTMNNLLVKNKAKRRYEPYKKILRSLRLSVDYQKVDAHTKGRHKFGSHEFYNDVCDKKARHRMRKLRALLKSK